MHSIFWLIFTCLQIKTYDDIVGKNVYARLRVAHHSEWEECQVIALVPAGIKIKSIATHELFIVSNNDVREDLRLMNAFVPWEKQQKAYKGKFFWVIYSLKFTQLIPIQLPWLFLAGDNAGEAFGKAGIGVYGRRLFRKNSRLYVEFKHRSSPHQKVVKRVRAKVCKETPSGIDETIRQWLFLNKSKASKASKSVVWIDTLFHRPIDTEVREPSYAECQNLRKDNVSRHSTPPVKRKSPETPSSLAKLEQARASEQYRMQKRKQRLDEKIKTQALVLFDWK